MLMPKRVKHRKQMRGRMKGKARRGNELHFGDYGLQALQPACLGIIAPDRGSPAGHGARHEAARQNLDPHFPG